MRGRPKHTVGQAGQDTEVEKHDLSDVTGEQVRTKTYQDMTSRGDKKIGDYSEIKAELDSSNIRFLNLSEDIACLNYVSI